MSVLSRICAAAAVALAAVSLCAGMALAQPACRNTGDFGRWLVGFRAEAAKAGISQRTIAAALDGMTLDEGIIRRDRGQAFFEQSFHVYPATMTSENRMHTGR